MVLRHKPLTAAGPVNRDADPRAILLWFEDRSPVPLMPPPRFREYGPLADDPDRHEAGFPIEAVKGLAFGIEYLDLRGWLSTRTIRCLALDPTKPGYLKAFCNVRRTTRVFRLDRIVSTTNLRTGKTSESGAERVLLAPYFLPEDPACIAFSSAQEAVKNGLYVLLSLAMAGGTLSADARQVVLSYVVEEIAQLRLKPPPMALVEIWIDNLSPTPDLVLAGIRELLTDKPAMTRLLPRILALSRIPETPGAPGDGALRELMRAVRAFYCPRRTSHTIDFVASR